jgi:hypothetical protein
MYADPQIGSVHAVADLDSLPLYHLPFFDGTFSAALKDGNDFSVMENGICRGLARYYTDEASFCGRRHGNTLVPGESP